MTSSLGKATQRSISILATLTTLKDGQTWQRAASRATCVAAVYLRTPEALEPRLRSSPSIFHPSKQLPARAAIIPRRPISIVAASRQRAVRTGAVALSTRTGCPGCLLTEPAIDLRSSVAGIDRLLYRRPTAFEPHRPAGKVRTSP